MKDQSDWGSVCGQAWHTATCSATHVIALLVLTEIVPPDAPTQARQQQYLFFSPGCLDGGKGLGHNLLMQLSTLGNSKM